MRRSWTPDSAHLHSTSLTGKLARALPLLIRVICAIRGETYFGAAEATMFSKRGSRRSGSHDGISFNLPKLGFGADVTRQTP
jgi:hypothetical protein